MKLILNYKFELLILSFLIVVYFILRLPNLTLQPIFADEAIYIRWAQVMKSEPTLRFLPLTDGKTPLFMWAMMPVFKIFDDPLIAGRILSVASGFLTLLGVFFLSLKVFGKKSAIWAALLYVIIPYTVFFDRMALVDSLLAGFTIWALYISIWLAQKPRLDLAMILGYFLGAGVLTKTPGMLNFLLAPTAILIFVQGKGKSIFKYILFCAVAILIGLVIYNLLRLGPEFRQLSARNADYVFSPFELIGRPLDPFLPHFNDIADWFPKLFSIPVLLSAGFGIFYTLIKKNKAGLVILCWILVLLILPMIFLRTFTARYLLSSAVLILVFAGFGISSILDKLTLRKYLKISLVLLIVLPYSLFFNYQLIVNPPPDFLPKAERIGYFEEWTAGYGFKEIASYLLERKKRGPVVVGTEGFFGTLPDGLQIYLDKSEIPVIGSTATISSQLRDSVKNKNQTFFVANKARLMENTQGLKLIMEFPKFKSEGGTVDAIQLFEVLP